MKKLNIREMLRKLAKEIKDYAIFAIVLSLCATLALSVFHLFEKRAFDENLLLFEESGLIENLDVSKFDGFVNGQHLYFEKEQNGKMTTIYFDEFKDCHAIYDSEMNLLAKEEKPILSFLSDVFAGTFICIIGTSIVLLIFFGILCLCYLIYSYISDLYFDLKKCLTKKQSV